jgi:NADH:ubiquinone oxidoreductase subunit H
MEGRLLSSAILSPAPFASPLALLPAPLLLAGALLLPLLSYVTVLIFIAAFTLFERKTMGLFQRREGPDRVGLEGFGQPFADGLKLVLKETLLPRQIPAPSVFYLAPLLSLTLSLALWLLLPLGAAGALVSSPISLLLLLALSSLGSYGVIYSGWSSNNKYALLGSLRAVAQFISYEIILSLLFLPFVAAVGSLNLWAVVSFQGAWGSFAYLAPLALIFAIAMLAETNRTPFDLPEAEAELVSGFNVEYSSLLFAFFFLAEYGSMGLMAALFVALFGGG